MQMDPARRHGAASIQYASVSVDNAGPSDEDEVEEAQEEKWPQIHGEGDDCRWRFERLLLRW